MYERTRRTDSGLITALVILFVLGGLTVFAVRSVEQYQDGEDMTRLTELRTEHTGIVADIISQPTRPDRPRLEKRLRDITARHNTILIRHPTWNVRPLDTLVTTVR